MALLLTGLGCEALRVLVLTHFLACLRWFVHVFVDGREGL